MSTASIVGYGYVRVWWWRVKHFTCNVVYFVMLLQFIFFHLPYQLLGRGGLRSTIGFIPMSFLPILFSTVAVLWCPSPGAVQSALVWVQLVTWDQDHCLVRCWPLPVPLPDPHQFTLLAPLCGSLFYCGGALLLLLVRVRSSFFWRS